MALFLALTLILGAWLYVTVTAYRGAMDMIALLLLELTPEGQHEIFPQDRESYWASGYRGVDVEEGPGGVVSLTLKEDT